MDSSFTMIPRNASANEKTDSSPASASSLEMPRTLGQRASTGCGYGDNVEDLFGGILASWKDPARSEVVRIARR